MIRAINKEDYKQIRKIWETYYSSEFDFPDFVTNYLCAFVVEEEGKIILASGIRTITEVVALTNKELSERVRVKALKQSMIALGYLNNSYGYNKLHAFVQDESWHRQLIKSGFNETKGKSLILEVS